MSAVLTAPPPLAEWCEFVDGEPRECVRSSRASYTAGTVFYHLWCHIRPRNLGWLCSLGATFRCFTDDPTRVRRADVAFHLLARLTADHVMSPNHCPVVPDIVVEVVSPHDTADDVNRKRVGWQQAGATLVWVVFPLDQEVYAFAADGGVRLFRRADTLTGEPVLADFRVPVADLFQLPAAP